MCNKMLWGFLENLYQRQITSAKISLLRIHSPNGVSNISHKHKNRFTTESHPKVRILTNFFSKRRKRGFWRVTNKFRGDWNTSWLDIHLTHQALISWVLSDKEEEAPVEDTSVRPHQPQMQSVLDFAAEGGEWGSDNLRV